MGLSQPVERLYAARWEEHFPANGSNMVGPCASALFRIKQKIQESTAEDPVTQWAKWLFADRNQRTISPYSKVSVNDYVNRQIQRANRGNPTWAFEYAPMHPLLLARLAINLIRPLGRSDGLIEEEHIEEANWCSKRAIKLAPENATVWWSRADFLEWTGRYEEAKAAVEAALRLDPSNGNAWYLSALLLEREGRTEEAYDAFVNAVDSASSGPPTPEEHGAAMLLENLRTLRDLVDLSAVPLAERALELASLLGQGDHRQSQEAKWLIRRAEEAIVSDKEKEEVLRLKEEVLKYVPEKIGRPGNIYETAQNL